LAKKELRESIKSTKIEKFSSYQKKFSQSREILKPDQKGEKKVLLSIYLLSQKD